MPAAEFAAKHGIAVEVSVPGIDAQVPAEAKAPMLRIVQEALQNVRKHAAATTVRISLEDDHLVIVDNGRGFDVMRLASATRNFGLQFMRERAELMGSSAPNRVPPGGGDSHPSSHTGGSLMVTMAAKEKNVAEQADRTSRRGPTASRRREGADRDRGRAHPVPPRRAQHPRARG